jgi:hypothetical protein
MTSTPARTSLVAWNPQRFLAPYAQDFIDALVAHCRGNYPNRALTRRAPPLPKPKESESQASKSTAARLSVARPKA